MKNRRSRIKATALKKQYSKLEKDTMTGGQFRAKGTRMVSGGTCPNCRAVVPGAVRVICCNKCGYTSKELKPYEMKRKLKKQKRLEYQKQEDKLNGKIPMGDNNMFVGKKGGAVISKEEK